MRTARILWSGPQRGLIAIAVSLAAACTAPPPQDIGDPVIGSRRAGQGRFGDRVCVDLIGLPAVWLEPDADDRRSPGLRAEAATGPGYAVRAAAGNRDQSIGVLYQGAFLAGERADADVDIHAVYVDFDVSVPVGEPGSPLYVHAAAGFGVGVLDFVDPRFQDRTTGALNIRLDGELALSRHLSLLAGVGGFLWGHPGDTEAFGSLLGFGGRLAF